ncbi:membrane protein [Streptomyces minutiscleroticus]|uniref:Membrane protein n=1 Tax=Streptomyces minutiscleroticus TaxID=68238 RepID=A0A918N7K8_9ACTN|nr:cytochrome b/b6 domain-containing protein [Streptomyces minutiscleroticus]GGX51224.1 membrane protein [Streptomyces minutiscleroticus]
MNSRRSNSSLPIPGRSAYGAASAAVLLLIPVVVLVGGDTVRDFLNFGAGVLSLVSLSCSVIWGLVAQDRIFLNTRQRIVGQAVHRTTAVASIAFLLLHITTKIALDHTTLIAAVIPFSLGVTGSAGLIGLGSAAGLLMIFVGITGALRSAFASPAPVAARWRAMHMLAYPAWCAALVHGLYAGREAKPIFVVLYGLSLLGVAGALALRAAPRPVKRRVADRIAAFLGTEERPGREGTETGRARAAGESALPGYEKQRPAASFAGTAASPRAGAPFTDPAAARPGFPSAPSFEAPARPAAAEPGFAAAYRAVSAPQRPQPPYASDLTSPLQTPLDMPSDLRPTETFPRFDGGGGAPGAWPIPSPPPVGEAPPSAYDPLIDTGYTIPAYGDPDASGYGVSDVRDTVESNSPYGTYDTGDTYNSGPATETLPGASYDFDAPGSGEPWNTPSGGFK